MSVTELKAPSSAEAEGSVVGALLARPKVAGEVVGTLLLPEHFDLPAFRALYTEILRAYYEDDPIDPLTVGRLCLKRLQAAWDCDESTALAKVRLLAQNAAPARAVAHAKLVKRDYDYRELMALARDVIYEVTDERSAPEELAGKLAQRATRIATSGLLTHDIVDFETLGRNYIRGLRQRKAAKDAGIETGIKFGFQFIDNFTRGLRPGYLFFLAGEPGVGKSNLLWMLSLEFAGKQLGRPQEERIGTMILSLEMSEEVSSTRVAQTLTHFDGGDLQEGSVTDEQLSDLIKAWAPRKGMPLYFNFPSAVTASQMRALVSEAVRKYNVGLVVIDHMRYFHMDDRRAYRRVEDEDEAKAEFLSEQIAGDLGVAVVCLAHTLKTTGTQDDRRPVLGDLRGGGMVAAHADFVAFLYQPYLHAKEADIEDGKVTRADAELIFRKNRHQLTATGHLHMNLASMSLRDDWPT